MKMTDKQQIANVERERAFLEDKLQNLIKQIGNIPINNALIIANMFTLYFAIFFIFFI